MSTHIIDRIAAVKFPKERTGYHEDYFITATLGGDNNCFVTKTGKRVSDWSPMAAGAHYKCLAKACGWAADAAGGCIRMARGTTTPESLIKNFRTALDSAPDYDSPEAVFRCTDTAITFTAEEKANGSKYYYERLIEKHCATPETRKIYLRGEVEAFVFDFTQPREAAKFIEYLPYKSPIWHHFSVTPTGWI